MTLTEFLLARIAEDEAAARACDVERWTISESRDGAWHGGLLIEVSESPNYDACIHPNEAAHTARWDPARVLAECEAKRRIVALHYAIDAYPGHDEGDCHECSDSGSQAAADGHYGVDMPCPTLRTLALPYADHPDYLEEWRP